ncbi:hypothetical protein B0H12DRAFT_1223597 [Mycena haematopus]|nr:hypothetical protein B0H12DRAFT_1223597 [Mycena haematopus]
MARATTALIPPAPVNHSSEAALGPARTASGSSPISVRAATCASTASRLKLKSVNLCFASADCQPHPLQDSDIFQLGVDDQGGAEDIYKSVKIRIEIGREWQSAANAFKASTGTCLLGKLAYQRIKLLD